MFLAYGNSCTFACDGECQNPVEETKPNKKKQENTISQQVTVQRGWQYSVIMLSSIAVIVKR